TYQFLTDSEREVNEAINAIEVDDRKVAQNIGSYLLTSNLIDAKYTYRLMKNQYIFEFNEYIDEWGLNRLSNNLNIQIISPLIADDYREIDFQQKASDGKNIIIVLKDDDRYIENYRHIEKINAYLQKPESRSDDKKQEIAFNRKAESKQVEEATQKMIKDDLIDADIYVLDDVLPKGSNFESRLEQAKKEIIDNSYRNLHYLTAVKTDQDILDTLKGKNKDDLFSDDEQAIKEIINYINVQASSMNNVSLANVIKRFGEIPYGYKLTDIAWMVAKAFVNGKVKLYFNNEQISLTSAQEDPKGTQRYLIGKNNIAKLTIKPVKEISMRQKRDAKDFVEDILNKRLSVDENTTSEQMADDIINKTKGFVDCLNALMHKKYNFDTPYPGHKLLAEGVNDLKAIVKVKDSDRVFQIISDHLDDYEDWHEELEDKAILEFYGDGEQTSSSQQAIWNKAHRYLDRYNYAKSMISDQDLIGIAQKIKGCLENDNFNNTIPKLKELNTQFADKYNDIIQEAYDKIEAQIQISLNVIKKRIAESDFPEDKDRELNDMAKNVFNTLLQKAKEYSNSASEDAYVSLVGLKNNIDSQTNEQKENIARVSSELAEQARKEQELREKKTAAEENDKKEPVSVAPVSNKTKPIIRVK
ncbi:MAG: BREX system P-loop protein BrxC, partial [Lactobacillus sp.]|nr:BREX system P-loop protein BrxC [Lactobacillus sp.]